MTNMKTSNNGIIHITICEGKFIRNRLHMMYKDSGGLPTIGYGHLLTQSENTSGKITINNVSLDWANGLTEEQADQLLAQDLVVPEQLINTNVTVDLTQHQFDALVSFTFNVGDGAFESSTLLKVLNQGQYDQIPTQMRRWVYAGGHIVPGLAFRREADIRMWNS